MRSFTFRVTCRFAALVTATTLAVLVTAGFVLDHEIEHGFELLHDIEVHELTELIGEDGSLSAAAIAERIKHDADSDAALFVIQVADAHGDVLFRSDNLGETILPTTSESAHWTATVPFLGRVHLSLYEDGPWRIVIGSPLGPSERLMGDYVRMCIPLLLGVGLASLGLGYAFSRSTLRPIRAIAATANRIRADNLAERIPESPGSDELAALTRLLNQMFDRLQSSFEEVRRFTADASHELKTPLALVRLNLEKVRPRLAADAEAAGAMADALEEIAWLNQVIDRLLFLARSDSGALALALQPLRVDAVVEAMAEDARVLAEDRGARFELGRNETGELRGDADLLRQLLLNLLANAVTATPAGGVVKLESFRTADGWHWEIRDEGPGIAPAELPRIFERFVRGRGAMRAGETRKGHGLGLAICKSIVELHRGKIRLENRAERSGLRVVVELPA